MLSSSEDRDEPPLEAASAVTCAAMTPRVRNLLERVSIRQRQSAAILRAHGRHFEAQRAQRSASRIDLTLAEPKAVQRMRALAERFAAAPDRHSLLQAAIEGALALTGADLGNIQMADAHGSLRIAVHYGLRGEFLEHFAAVDDNSSACGRAAIQGRQAVIADVRADPAFARHRAIALASGFRAVQSTPLVDPGGRLRGVISTHFRRSGRPADRDLQIIDWYGEQLAAALPAPALSPTPRAPCPQPALQPARGSIDRGVQLPADG